MQNMSMEPWGWPTFKGEAEETKISLRDWIVWWKRMERMDFNKSGDTQQCQSFIGNTQDRLRRDLYKQEIQVAGEPWGKWL